MKAEQPRRTKQTLTPNKQSRNAWLSLALVFGGLLASGLYAAVDSTPGEGDIVFPLLIILAMVAAFSFGIRALAYWPARIALILVCVFVIVPPIAKRLQPDPFPSFEHRISEGMTIEEVKEILGEPDKSERLAKLVNEPIDFQLLDEEGNPIDRDHVVKAVEGDLLLHFRIRRTTVVVRFDEANRVKNCYEHFDIN